MATYNYSLSTDFSGSINEGQFHSEIANEVGITTTFYGITTIEDTIEVLFASSLSGGEETILNGLVSSHVPTYIKPHEIFFTIQSRISEITNTTYSRLITFKYDGSDNIGDIDYVEIICWKDSNVTSYDIRLVNRQNSDVIAEATGLTNNTLDINDLGTISNIPTESTILELQGRRVGGSGNNKNVYIESANIYYNN